MILISVYVSMIVLLLIMGIAYHCKPKNQKRKKMFVVVSCLVMFLIMAMRSPSVGTDAQTIVGMFMANRTIFSGGFNAFFYNFVSKIGYFIWPNGQMILIINAAIICTAIGVFVYHNSDDAFLSIYLYVTLYFFFNSMNIMRQYDAIAMSLISYTAYMKKKNVTALLFALLSVGFHSTAIVFFAFAFVMIAIKSMHRLSNQILLFAGLVFVLGYLFQPMLVIFARIFPHYAMYVGDEGLTLTGYTSEGKKVLITLMFLFVLMFAYITIQKTRNVQENFVLSKALCVNFFFVLVAVAFGLAGGKLQLISRVESYFSIFFIIFAPEVVKMIDVRYRRAFYIGFVLIMIVPMMFQLKSNNSEVLPYNLFL